MISDKQIHCMYTELFSHCVILALLHLQDRHICDKREVDHVTMKFTLSLNLPTDNNGENL